ncbi:MAG TPA: methylated-DNA--[protein]-cysteine S-methyltransferase [Phycisphaerae bacterium]|nr:methylated-DNA--[protein]-cysteine S-methyltransferase [Phycisphaerae bacterium]
MVVAEPREIPILSNPRGGFSPQLRKADGPTYHMALIPTAWGNAGAVWMAPPDDADATFTFSQKPSSALLCRIVTPGLSCHDLRAQLLRQFPGCQEVFGDGRLTFHPEVVPEWFPELVRYLQQYYTADLRDRTQPRVVDHWTLWAPRLDWSGVTPFQRRVLELVAGIPCGCKRTYGEVARALGNAAASRAVGAALRRNPWPVLVPCHRVVGSTGAMTGFTAPGGVETKRRMLDLEGQRRGGEAAGEGRASLSF